MSPCRHQLPLVVVVVYVLVVAVVHGVRVGRDRCEPDRLAIYTLVLDTHWSRDAFPKQYPEVRPPAQWSKLVGRSHDKSFSLFSVGNEAGRGVQMFAETGRSDALEEISQGEDGVGVYDEFNGPPIARGKGRTETDFFTDGNHTRVSAVVRMIPSPDWFIGLDGLDLCSGGYWIDAISVEVNPLDAGTDDGFTYSAPNWPSDPAKPISRITSRDPHHPANSFFYPDIDQLPAIATFHLIKERVYKLSSGKRRRPPPALPGNRTLITVDHPTAALHNQDEISNDLLLPPTLPPTLPQHRRNVSKNRPVRNGNRRALPVSCHVGTWSVWSSCSVSCGVGDQTRTRLVLRHARRGGRPCPPLTEKRWCGEHTKCPQNFFNW